MGLHDFAVEAWEVLENNKFNSSRHVEAICEHAEECINGGSNGSEKESSFKRLLINVPPGMTKSMIVSIILPCWVWTYKPWFRWLCGSYDQPTSDDFSQKRRILLASEWYQERWPESSILFRNEVGKKRDTIRLIQNLSGGEMLATSPKSRAMGKHPHGIIFDDLHNPKAEESLSEVDLRNVRNWVEWACSTRGAAIDIDVRVIMIMQRLAIGDSSDVLKEIGCEHLLLPMRFDPMHPVRDPALPTKIGFVDWRTKKGELLCPERFPEETVQMMEKTLRNRAAAQLQQMPVNPEGDRFKRVWFSKVVKREDLPSDIYSKGKAVRYWDKAYTEGGGDFTAGVLIVQHKGSFYVYDVVRGQWGSSNRNLHIEQTTERDGALWSNYAMWQEQEPSAGKEVAENMVDRLKDYRVYTDRVRDPKHVRYNDWEEELDFITNPREATVFIVEGAWNRAFIDEHCAWRWESKEPVDDQIDAAANGFMKLKRRKTFLVAGA